MTLKSDLKKEIKTGLWLYNQIDKELKKLSGMSPHATEKWVNVNALKKICESKQLWVSCQDLACAIFEIEKEAKK